MYYPEGGVEQLFDLQNDPHELRNLVGDPAYEDQWEELHRTMVQRHEARRSPLVADGQLLRLPLKGDSTRDRRNTSWPGYHTELYDVDVRH